MTLEEILRQLDADERLGVVGYALAEDLIRAAYEAGKLAPRTPPRPHPDDIGRCSFDTRNAAGVFRRCTRTDGHGGPCW